MGISTDPLLHQGQSGQWDYVHRLSFLNSFSTRLSQVSGAKTTHTAIQHRAHTKADELDMAKFLPNIDQLLRKHAAYESPAPRDTYVYFPFFAAGHLSGKLFFLLETSPAESTKSTHVKAEATFISTSAMWVGTI